jgi:hypothetical protein
MKVQKSLIPMLVLVFAAFGTIAAYGQSNWVKLGEKDVDHKIDHDTIVASDKGHIREIHLAVRNAPIKFSRVVINYRDGMKQELEFLEDVAVGHESRSINIEGDGHVIKSLDFWYETDSLGGKKAKVTVYGRS